MNNKKEPIFMLWMDTESKMMAGLYLLYRFLHWYNKNEVFTWEDFIGHELIDIKENKNAS